jgi:hypothetical protein
VIVVRSAAPEDFEACLDIVRRLPAFFTPDVPETVRSDLGRHSAWVVDDADDVVGFAVVDRRRRSRSCGRLFIPTARAKESALC